MFMTLDLFFLQISEINVIIDQISKENFVLTEEKDVLTVCFFMYDMSRDARKLVFGVSD